MASEEREEWYSVWALPPEGVRTRLKALMSSLRSEFGGPEFEPHVTVVGLIRLKPSEAIRLFQSSCRDLKTYTVRVSALSCGDFFYECVYLLVDPIPEVVEASELCCGHMGYKRSAAYNPHLSLLYGDLSDEIKEKARQKVEELEKCILELNFDISVLALYRTDIEDKTLKSWEMVASCDLTAVSCNIIGNNVPNHI